MELRPGYRQTEVGVFPTEWEIDPLAQHAAFRTGPFGSALHKSDYTSDGIPVVNPTHIVDGKIEPTRTMTITDHAAKNLSEFRMKAGEIVIGRRGDMGRCAVVLDHQSGWLCGTGSMIIRPLNTDAEFLQRVLSSPRAIAAIEDSSAGTTMVNLNQGTLSGLKIQFPPLAEQRAIAAALSDVDALLDGLERLIAKKRDLKQAAMQQLLTGQNRLPGFHEEWEVSTVGREFEIQLGKMLDAEKNLGVPKPFIGNRAVQWGGIEVSDLQTVPMSRSDIDRFRLKRGDLLVCEGGEVGRAAIWDAPIEECYYQKALHRLRPIRGFDPRLMAALLRLWSDRGFFSNYVTQTSIAHLPREKFLKMPLLVLSTAEQTAIAAVLSDMDAELSALEARRDKTRALKQGMMQELLTGRIRLVSESSNVVPVDFATIPKHAPSDSKPHNWQFNEAVVVAMLVKQFGSEQYPL
jgi:type I restriction enzyme, S subunit